MRIRCTTTTITLESSAIEDEQRMAEVNDGKDMIIGKVLLSRLQWLWLPTLLVKD